MRSYSAAVASSILGSSSGVTISFSSVRSAVSPSPLGASPPSPVAALGSRPAWTTPPPVRCRAALCVEFASCRATLRHVAMLPSGPAPPGTVTSRLTFPSPSASVASLRSRLRSETNAATASAAHVPARMGLSSTRANRDVFESADVSFVFVSSSPSARYPVSKPTMFRATPSPTIRPFRPLTASGLVSSPASRIARPTSSAARVF
mmetsp:Transcript_12056/g.55939  ORF Transcript_12056/g.55939 Transcript_12056/m.55939 type:complete len:206 (+) Transcript_12056:614-1231(+)